MKKHVFSTGKKLFIQFSMDFAGNVLISILGCHQCGKGVEDQFLLNPCGHSFCSACKQGVTCCPSCGQTIHSLIENRDRKIIISIFNQMENQRKEQFPVLITGTDSMEGNNTVVYHREPEFTQPLPEISKPTSKFIIRPATLDYNNGQHSFRIF